jgi:type III secretion protein V
VPFLVIGTLLFVVYRARSRALRRAARLPGSRHPSRPGPRFVPVVAPWTLDVSEDLSELIDDVLRGEQVQRRGIRTAAESLREELFEQLGVPLPSAQVRVVAGMQPRSAVLSVFEVPVRAIALPASLQGEEAVGFIHDGALSALRSRASEFLGISETQQLLDQLEQHAPALVRQVVPKPIPLALLADILRRLVEERVSVRDLRAILEVLASAPAGDKDPYVLAETVRGQLRRATSFRLTCGSGALPVYLLDAEIEETVRAAVQRTQAGSFLALAPAPAREIVASVRSLVSASPAPEGTPRVLLTQPDIRRFVRKLLDSDSALQQASVEVVSPNDLTPELHLRPLGRATLRGS